MKNYTEEDYNHFMNIIVSLAPTVYNRFADKMKIDSTGTVNITTNDERSMMIHITEVAMSMFEQGKAVFNEAKELQEVAEISGSNG